MTLPSDIPAGAWRLTALDIIVLILVGGGAIFSLMREIRPAEILSLFAWVAAIVALKLFFTPVANWLDGTVGTHAGAVVLAFVIIFAVTFFGGRMLAGHLGRRTRQSVLGPLDRVLGCGFGAIKGLLGATVLLPARLSGLRHDLRRPRAPAGLDEGIAQLSAAPCHGRGGGGLGGGAARARLVSALLYNAAILRLAVSIPHHQRLDAPEATAERRSPVCGSRVTRGRDAGRGGTCRRAGAGGEGLRARSGLPPR